MYHSAQYEENQACAALKRSDYVDDAIDPSNNLPYAHWYSICSKSNKDGRNSISNRSNVILSSRSLVSVLLSTPVPISHPSNSLIFIFHIFISTFYFAFLPPSSAPIADAAARNWTISLFSVYIRYTNSQSTNVNRLSQKFRSARYRDAFRYHNVSPLW